MQLRPDERGSDVDRGVLPDGALRARQTADVEAIHPDQCAGMVSRDMVLDRVRTLGGLRGDRYPSDETQALGPSADPVALEDAPDAALFCQDGAVATTRR